MEDKSSIRIVDIAKLAGVSVGTVDRVLHNRGRVSEEKRSKIEKVLKEINYEPNMVARFLASKKDYTFAVLIPYFIAGEYWELVTTGIDKATTELKDFNVAVEYFFFDQQDEYSFNNTVKSLDKREFAGVVIATIFGESVIGLSQKLEEKEIPYIYIDSDIPAQHNLAYIGADSHMSGIIAAKLMMREISETGDIIIGKIRYKGTSNSVQMETREQGFKEYLNKNGFKGQIYYLEIDTLQSEDVLNDLKSTLKDTTNHCI
ncbi:regulatory LacI family protein [Dysgonomonas alginatilytica]|uniref:Regulatory LacI family protein n=1 Tax=Dysgonomonas alginatilytica TaxID=1605892 RepID=A0A2V3PRX7_9BACT|nr:LacI family DNA-binding transcriptional regulator [Dysgonomonas alginatilytica]PXV65123.1 regulatory LacI family protein [Dysgonomonas alginatilytica]